MTDASLPLAGSVPAGWVSRRGIVLGASAGALCAPWGASRAAPVAGGRPVTLVVSYPAGGGADLMARIIAPRMGEALGQGMVVDNRPGGGGQVAGAFVARAAPDGATLLVDASSFAVNPSLYPKMAYDIGRDFTPLAVLATFPNVLVCSADFPARTVLDVVRMARQRPGAIAYASSGNGSAQHLAGALFEQRAGVKLSHVPYRGGGPAMKDVIGGLVPLFFANVASALSHIRSGTLRALAVTASVRARSLPTVPTMAEVGVPQYEVLEWNPVLAPAGLPADTREALVGAIRKTLADSGVQARVQALGGDMFADASQASAGRFIQAQQAQWAQVVREGRISVG
ncbi:tripartite tricarboxylate transporter substrate binding protein [Paracidovorax oryzae]|uniref:tripartite tricarboxylate transporter substrate binding protein n=1 Tax=Paracidovorax oryzae TaxID=862720 RepID=UPI000479F6EC|nr:tripartite tricarboxylate transporter substrate binding protein [Paracidovorax oryzae]